MVIVHQTHGTKAPLLNSVGKPIKLLGTLPRAAIVGLMVLWKVI